MKSLVLALLVLGAQSADNEAEHHANPIRKVVTMLQNMKSKVENEGAKEKELYDKFMCYCKNGGDSLSGSIGSAETKVPQLGSDIEKSEAEKVQTEADLKKHQTDRSAAKTAIAKATAIRGKEAAAFAAEKADYDANIASVKKAVTALENGMAGNFLQTAAAKVITKLALSGDMEDGDRHELIAFFSQSQDSEYAPSSGEITGILKTMQEDMQKNLDEAQANENGAVTSFEELIAAKNKEVESLTKAIETKIVRVGNLGVEIATMKNDLTDTQEGLIEDQQFLAEMGKTCKTKEQEFTLRLTTRGEELVALAETIKILNDDDALEMFKKTLPGASASFVQMAVNTNAVRAKAALMLEKIAKSDSPHQHQIDFVMLALRGKTQGFEKVIKMIDNMVATMKQEQLDDDHEKEYCLKQFDFAEDKKKGLETDVADLATAIADAEEGTARLAEEIEALDDGIKAMDKSVEEATVQRQEEHEECTELMANNGVAKDLLNFAKNRLNKFYNPKLYKAPPKRELSEDERITLNMGGTLAPTEAPGGIAGTGIGFVQAHNGDAPPPPPDTWAKGGYKKKGEESSGVIAMIDLLVKDLDKEMQEADFEEKDAQKDYETMMTDSASKRVQDSKSLTAKTKAKADLQSDIEQNTETTASTQKELMATEMYIGSLHAQCDWLIKYYDMRKEARAQETDSLNKAKAVLSGADFSMLQTKASSFLGRA